MRPCESCHQTQLLPSRMSFLIRFRFICLILGQDKLKRWIQELGTAKDNSLFNCNIEICTPRWWLELNELNTQSYGDYSALSFQVSTNKLMSISALYMLHYFLLFKIKGG